MDFKTLSWKIEDTVGHLVLDQPPANIMTREFFDELSLVTHNLIPGSGIHALVIYGNGRHFSSGADPNDLAERIGSDLPASYPAELPPFLSRNASSLDVLDRLPVPTFAAIRGSCLGSALELALVCRYRICGEGAVLGFPESSFGLMPGCGGTVRLPSIAGRAKAIELILGGRNFSAKEAFEWGIVHKIVPRKHVVEETLRIAKKMIR